MEDKYCPICRVYISVDKKPSGDYCTICGWRFVGPSPEYSCSQCGQRTFGKGYSDCISHRWDSIVRKSTPEQLRQIVEMAFVYGAACVTDEEAADLAPEWFCDGIKDGTIQ